MSAVWPWCLVECGTLGIECFCAASKRATCGWLFCACVCAGLADRVSLLWPTSRATFVVGLSCCVKVAVGAQTLWQPRMGPTKGHPIYQTIGGCAALAGIGERQLYGGPMCCLSGVVRILEHTCKDVASRVSTCNPIALGRTTSLDSDCESKVTSNYETHASKNTNWRIAA